jgi:hypothetical protein
MRIRFLRKCRIKEVFFSEEKNQKTYANFGAALLQPSGLNIQKFFGFFFVTAQVGGRR